MLEHSDPPDEDVATEGQVAVGPIDAAAGSAPAAVPPPVPELSPAACAARLAELFPAVFSPGAHKPLKLRIQADIQARAPGIFTRKALSGFLHRHTTSTAYLRALVNSPQRFDLDGVPAGEVASEHREAAADELQRRRTLHEARRAAERETQRAAQREARNAEQQAQRAAQRETQNAARESQTAQRDAQRAERATQRPEPEAQRPVHAQPQRAPVAQDPEQRNRLALLRAFESSTLSRSNFCVLKGVTEAELDALLAQARQEQPPAPVGSAAQVAPASSGAADRARQPRHRPGPGRH